MSGSEDEPKLSLRGFADGKAVSFTVQDLTCWYSCGLSAEFSIIVWTMVIIGSFSFIYFKSGGAYSKHQFTAQLDLKDDTVNIASNLRLSQQCTGLHFTLPLYIFNLYQQFQTSLKGCNLILLYKYHQYSWLTNSHANIKTDRKAL